MLILLLGQYIGALFGYLFPLFCNENSICLAKAQKLAHRSPVEEAPFYLVLRRPPIPYSRRSNSAYSAHLRVAHR